MKNLKNHCLPIGLLLLLLSTPSLSYAWVIIEGWVGGSSGAVGGAMVTTDFATVKTIDDGTYFLSLPEGTFDMTVSALGFVPQTVSITASDYDMVQNFQLTAAPITVEAVDPNWGETGQEMEILIQGTEFDENTGVSMALDTGNSRSLIGNMNAPSGDPASVTVEGTVAYVFDNESGRLQLIDIDPDRDYPAIIGVVDIPSSGSHIDIEVAVVGGIAYVANGYQGLHLVDIDPRSDDYLRVTHTIDTPGQANGVTVKNGIAYVADGDAGLQLVDITPTVDNPTEGEPPIANPDYLTIIGEVLTPAASAHEVVVVDNVAYVTDGWAGLHLINVDWASGEDYLTIIDSSAEIPNAWGVNVIGTIAYVTDRSSGLYLIDIDPANIETTYLSSLGSINPPAGVFNIAINETGTLAYMANLSSGLNIVDLDSSHGEDYLQIIHTVSIHSDALDVTLAGTTAYVTSDCTDEGLVLVDLDPNNTTTYRTVVDTVGTQDVTYNATVDGSVAYIASGTSGLQLADIDPASPGYLTFIGTVDTPDIAHDVTVAGTVAYVADERSGLQLIDIDPDSPDYLSVIDFVDTPGRAYAVSVENGIAYVADGDFGLQLIDVDPTNIGTTYLTVINSVPTPGKAIGVTVVGNVAYVADYDSGLQLVDMADPLSLSIIGAVDTPGRAYGVIVEGNVAYVADAWSGLQVVDVDPSNPNSPEIIGSVGTFGEASDVTIEGTVAYLATGTSGLQSVNIDPTSPDYLTLIGTVNTSDEAIGVTVKGSVAYVADSKAGLQLVDVSKPAPVVLIGSVDTPDDSRSVTLGTTVAYVADGWSGLQLIDIDSASPDYLTVIESVDTPGFAFDVTIEGTLAYVADGNSGLQVIDIDPNNSSGTYLTRIGSVETLGIARAVTVAGTIAYVTDEVGLKIINIDSDSQEYTYLQIIASVDTPGEANDVAVSGDYAYVVDGDIGLQVIDIASTTPTIISSITTLAYTESVVIVGTMAIVLDSAVMNFIDISDPYNPISPGFIDLPGDPEEVVIEGSLAYVADGESGIDVIDIDSNSPTAGAIVGSVSTPGYAWGVKIRDNIAYVAGGPSGFSVVPVPVVLARNNMAEDTADLIHATIPATDLAGNYTIRVFNNHWDNDINHDELPGAVTLSDTKTASKAIIVAGYGPHSSNWLWDETRMNANFAYKALRWQGYSHEDIYYLSSVPEDLDGDGNMDVDGDATLANLEDAILNWTSGADDLVLYLVDHGGQETFHIKYNTTALQAGSLAGWLNTLQDNPTFGRVIVVYEGCYSGSFLDAFKIPDGKSYERVIMTSSTADEKSKLLAGGALSFSYQFWAMILDTGNMVTGFNHGKEMMESSQTAWLDANGDGEPNNSTYDTISNPIIGRGYKSAPGVPSIVVVSPSQQISETTSAELWAEVISLNNLTRVWAMLVPPEYDKKAEADSSLEELPLVELSYSEASRHWESSWDQFTANGTYTITFYARDSEGNISIPKSSTVTHTVGPDAYEDDDSAAQAKNIVLNKELAQFHTIHEQGDSDWLKFYGLAGKSYAIKVDNAGPKMDAIIEIYDSNGTTLIKSKNTIGALPGVGELLTWDDCARNDIYYIRIYHANPLASGIGNNYDLTFYNPDLSDFPEFVSISGMISADSIGVEGATVTAISMTTGEEYSALVSSASDGSYSMELPTGDYIISVTADGFESKISNLQSIQDSGSLPQIALIAEITPPIAFAGSDRVVNNCDSVTLDGSASYDPNGTVTTWDWTLFYEGDSSLDKTATGETPTITNLEPGKYSITLVVGDDEGGIGEASMELSVGSAWGDVNGDCQIGLEEVINGLQTITGQE